MGLWKDKADRLQKNTTRKIAESLADPVRYENLFPEYSSSLRAESYLRELAKLAVPASVRAPTNQCRNVMEELETALSTGAVTFDEAGQAHLRGVPRKPAPVPNSLPNSVPHAAATAAATAVAPPPPPPAPPVPPVVPVPVPIPPLVPDVSRKRTPSPPPRQPTPEPEPEPEIVVRQISDDDSDGLSRDVVSVATAAAAHSEPDVVSERPRPDVVPRHGGPDLLPSAAGRAPQPEVVVDAGEVRWSDEDFGDAEDGDNDINLDDLNLDDED